MQLEKDDWAGFFRMKADGSEFSAISSMSDPEAWGSRLVISPHFDSLVFIAYGVDGDRNQKLFLSSILLLRRD